MSRLLDRLRAGWPAGGPNRPLLATLLVAALAPLATLAGIVTSAEAPPASQLAYGAAAEPTDAAKPAPAAASAAMPAAPPPTRVDARTPGNLQMRCWDYGQLVFEENGVSLPAPGSPHAIKPIGTDRYGRPIYLTDTATSTCLIRSPSERRTTR